MTHENIGANPPVPPEEFDRLEGGLLVPHRYVPRLPEEFFREQQTPGQTTPAPPLTEAEALAWKTARLTAVNELISGKRRAGELAELILSQVPAPVVGPDKYGFRTAWSRPILVRDMESPDAEGRSKVYAKVYVGYDHTQVPATVNDFGVFKKEAPEYRPPGRFTSMWRRTQTRFKPNDEVVNFGVVFYDGAEEGTDLKETEKQTASGLKTEKAKVEESRSKHNDNILVALYPGAALDAQASALATLEASLADLATKVGLPPETIE
ncbi:MAG TPA: hypothetical protein VLG37_03725 [Candidatus Saccharimonadales bacterium]|nr:hypothetical protein [Candidatus Saccharimonadales bacterium]